MALRDVLTDDQMADEIGVPVALVKWARKKDASVEPPPLEDGYDLALQQGIADQVRRANSAWGAMDGRAPY